MLVQVGRGMVRHVCPEHLLLLGADEGWTTRMGRWIERSALPPQDGVAFDGCAAHPKGAGCLALAHAAIDCGHDLGSQVGRICAHTSACYFGSITLPLAVAVVC